MKTLKQALLVFALFFFGTTAVVHIDRQCALMNGEDAVITEALENTAENIIEKYASLL